MRTARKISCPVCQLFVTGWRYWAWLAREGRRAVKNGGRGRPQSRADHAFLRALAYEGVQLQEGRAPSALKVLEHLREMTGAERVTHLSAYPQVRACLKEV